MQDLEDAALAVATDHGLVLYLAAGSIHRGWLHATDGHTDEGLARMREGIAGVLRIGAHVRVPIFLAAVADVCEKTRRTAEGLAAVNEALALADASGQHYWTAELHRLKGALVLQGGDRSGAEASFREALAVARRQGAKSLELRAAMSASRLWARDGKPGDAHDLLADVYAWFTEGFDTADLRAAEALLTELRAAASPGGRRPPRRRA
jgi:predicted ATPase